MASIMKQASDFEEKLAAFRRETADPMGDPRTANHLRKECEKILGVMTTKSETLKEVVLLCKILDKRKAIEVFPAEVLEVHKKWRAVAADTLSAAVKDADLQNSMTPLEPFKKDIELLPEGFRAELERDLNKCFLIRAEEIILWRIEKARSGVGGQASPYRGR